MRKILLKKGGIIVNYNETIGANIRFERRQRGLTIDEFAKVINMAPGFVGLIERGQRGTSMSNIVKIADFFGITLDQLIRTDIETKTKKTESSKPLTKADKDRKALYSMIGLLSDSKIRILTANAKALNKYMAEDTPVEDDEEEVID